jgi:hypothetical protein
MNSEASCFYPSLPQHKKITPAVSSILGLLEAQI